MLIVVDGPEKTGKSTMVRHLATLLHNFNVVTINSRYTANRFAGYMDALKMSTRPDTFVIMDRAWPSEAVYSTLLNRQAAYPDWWCEWCLGLPARTLGLVLFTNPPNRLGPLDSTDYVLDYEVERRAYEDYAAYYGYETIDTTQIDPLSLVDRAVDIYSSGARPPAYAGNRRPKLLIAGECRNTVSTEPLAWGPLSTRYWKLELEHGLLRRVCDVGWDSVGLTNAAETSDDHVVQAVTQAARVIAYGVEANRVIRSLVNPLCPVESRTHPAALFRWGKYNNNNNHNHSGGDCHD